MSLLTAVFYLIKARGREGLIWKPPRNMHLTSESDLTGSAVSRSSMDSTWSAL